MRREGWATQLIGSEVGNRIMSTDKKFIKEFIVRGVLDNPNKV